MKKVVLIVFTLIFGLVIFSCKKTTNPTPGPPVVTFKDFRVVSETEAYFHFGFTDPDGDIGLKNGDTTGAFAFGAPYYFDFHMEFLKFDSATQSFIPGIIISHPTPGQTDSIGIFKYRIPFVDNKSKDKSLAGEVYVDMTGFRPYSTLKRFKYKFYIFDRAHNKSNVVTTPEFNYP